MKKNCLILFLFFSLAAFSQTNNDLPIGVFDSGTGGLTVMEAILTLDAFNNNTGKPGSDGKPDFEQFGFSKHENCYLFRWLAVSEKEEHKNIFKNNPQLLGRVFYQLAQRRGFRKGDDDNETDLIENGRIVD